MHLVIYEDSRWHDFAPFSLSRPVFSLASGMTSLLEKQIRHANPTRLTLWVRPEMESFCRDRTALDTSIATQVNVPLDDEPAVLINARTACSERITAPEMIHQPGLGPADVLGDSVAWTGRDGSSGQLLDSAVDLLYWNDRSIVEDFAAIKEPSAAKPAGPYHLVNEANIWLGADVTLAPGCVLDASKGPIALAAGAAIGANAVVQGPCYIGPGSIVAPLANIRPGTSVGPFCRVGGEVSVSILLGYSNKSHEGFMGHTYVGKWVNFGAGTTTSNLKNTYGPISLHRGNRDIPTGRKFLGALIGDHCKTAIGTRLMGGSYVGYCSMLAGSTIAPRFAPSYTFWTDKGVEQYQKDKAAEVARRVFSRRDRVWTDTDEQIMNYVERVAPQFEV